MKCQVLFSRKSKKKETICMKCQVLFSRKNKKNISLSPAESAHGMKSVTETSYTWIDFLPLLQGRQCL